MDRRAGTCRSRGGVQQGCAVSRQRSSGLDTTRDERQAGQPLGQRRGLRAAALVEVDAGLSGRPARRWRWRWSGRAGRGSGWACGARYRRAPGGRAPRGVIGPTLASVIVDCAVYRDGRRLHRGPTSARTLAGVRLREPGEGFVWIGLKDPTRGGVRRRRPRLRPAPARRRGRRQRRTSVPSSSATTTAVPGAEDALVRRRGTTHVETGEVMLFLGRRVRRQRCGAVRGSSCTGVRARPGARSQQLLRTGPSAVAVRGAGPRRRQLRERSSGSCEIDVDEVEETCSRPRAPPTRRGSTPSSARCGGAAGGPRRCGSRCSSFARGSSRASTRTGPFFRDVADHLARVADARRGLDWLLSTAFDAHLARVAVQQNKDMRKISAVGGDRRPCRR